MIFSLMDFSEMPVYGEGCDSEEGYGTDNLTNGIIKENRNNKNDGKESRKNYEFYHF